MESSYKIWHGLTPDEWDLYDKENFAGTGEEFKKVLEEQAKGFTKTIATAKPVFAEIYSEEVDYSWTVEQLNAVIEEYELDVNLRLKKAEKIEAINKLLG